MDFAEYELEARKTDQLAASGADQQLAVELLMQSATRASRLESYARTLQEPERTSIVAEQLGDVLWYLAAASRQFGVTLDDIAAANLSKLTARWTVKSDNQTLYDASYPKHEQLPRTVRLRFRERDVQGVAVVAVFRLIGSEEVQLGNEINDNSHDDDGYRYHDVLHLAYMAYLGWSPVMRALLHKKRKSNSEVDEVEDGARARDVEEGLTASIFKQAKIQRYFEGATRVDHQILRTADVLTRGLEVNSRPFSLWAEAILAGYKVFRELRHQRGGVVEADLVSRQLSYIDEPDPREAEGVPNTSARPIMKH
jgi:MazG C-terminal domain